MFKLCRIILIAFVAVCGYCLWLIGSMLGGGLVALIVMAGIVWAAKRKRTTLTAYGTARWASENELRHAGMTEGGGLIVGRLLGTLRPPILTAMFGLINPWLKSTEACNRLLWAVFPKEEVKPPLVRLSRAVHTAVFAPTGAGKGVSCVIPFLLNCLLSCVVVDFKGELARTTMAYRRRIGQRVVLLDPYHLVTDKPDTFNPVASIKRDSSHALDEGGDLAESLVIRTGHEHDPHWADSAELVLRASIAAVVQYADEDDRSLQTVRDILCDPRKFEGMAKLLCESDAYDGILARIGYSLTHFKDKELGSTMTTVNRYLRFLDSPAIAASTKSSSFDPAELLAGKMTIYLILPPEHSRAQSPLLRMWVSSLFRAVLRGGLQE